MIAEYLMPGFAKTQATPTVQRSRTTGAIVEVVSDAGNMKLFRLSFPDFDGHSKLQETYADMSALQRDYVIQWVRWAAVTIGTGFHPDTPSDDYQPPLDPVLSDEYDLLLGLSHDYADPYEISIEAWEAAGIVEGDENNAPLH